MSILIKGMEMPKDGTFNIIHIYSDGRVSLPYWGKGMQVTKGIEAVSVPPHGDLIDRSVAYDKIAEQEGGYYVDMDAVDKGLEATPVIIPAEEEE